MAFTSKLEAYNGGWVDLSNDRLARSRIRWSSGIAGGGPADRVAGSGELSYELNNSAGNTAGLLGRFSPGHSNALAGWDFGLKTRISLERGGVRRYKWVGWIDDIRPTPGVARDRGVRVDAIDLMGMAADWKISGIATQINKRSDELFAIVRDNLPLAPESSTLGTGRSTFAYALDTSRDESLSVMGEWQRLAASELGYIFLKGDTTAGGQLVFQSRADRAASVTNLHTFSNNMVGLDVRRSRASVFNKIQVTAHPRRVDGAAVVLCELESQPRIGPGESYTWLASYRDPEQKAARVGGSSMVTPVAVTDYEFNSLSDGSGVDLTAGLSVSAAFGGNGVRFTLENTGQSTGYVTKLQARGLGIYDFENFIAEIENTASQAAIGPRVGSLDMAYESDARMAAYAAQYLAAVYADDGLPSPESVTLEGTDNDTLEAAIFELEVGDRIGLVESVSGLSLGGGSVARGYFIQSVDAVIGPAPNQIRATYGLAPAGRTRFWRIGVSGATAIGVGQTLLGF